MIIYGKQVTEGRMQTYCEMCLTRCPVMDFGEITRRLRTSTPVVCWECSLALVNNVLLEEGSGALVDAEGFATYKAAQDARPEGPTWDRACLLLHISTNGEGEPDGE